MPFDALPQRVVDDVAALRVALAGVRDHWHCGRLGAKGEANHCAIGWLLVATDWDTTAATQLALDYVYPALPKRAQRNDRVKSVYRYNDYCGQSSVIRLFERAVALAEEQAVR